MPRIALATSLDVLPPGDLALCAALERLGVAGQPVIWSSPHVGWGEFGLVVIRSCWDYHLRLDEFLDWLDRLDAESVRVANDPVLVRWNSRKTYLRDLAAAGLPVPDTVWLDAGDEADLASLCASRGWDDAVVKPVVSASAHHTERRRSGMVRGPRLVQRFEPAIEREGEWSVVFLGGRWSHDARKRPCDGDFRVQVEHGGSVSIEPAPTSVRALAGATLAALPHPATLARIDIVGSNADARLMEVEVIEPELFLDLVDGAADRAAEAVLSLLR